MNIAVITSGGDSSGMNPCLAQIVKCATQQGHVVYGYRRGFLGIRDNDYTILRPCDVQDWHKKGGTELRTGRFPELKEKENQELLIAQLAKNQIDALIVLGGDGSFKGARELSGLNPQMNIVGIPCTIDNNIYGSDYTLGYDTALNKQVDYLDGISDTGMAMPGRVFFVETLGAWDGYLTHSSVLMGMADFSVLVEKPMTNEKIAQEVLRIRNSGEKDYVVVMFAEGDSENTITRMVDAADYVKKNHGLNVKCNLVGFQQRGGVPTATDRLRAAGFAQYAVNAVTNKIQNVYVVYTDGKYQYMDIEHAFQRKTFDEFEIK
ncbi:6-phosphofructokinase [Anaerotignum sp. MB30-C6]|uniref:6-phosphofructokinase n=1 Tax=Anaerotignum sp. MB30-C6 TaxID=3070814 RepID=UPI0027DBFD54|nr:6-phosphofructokinase [Anaerotignum sp. MB30-C6]WMI79947.1 6-phosphofructokinase [Anaerotignum sp. MB30-C6]